MIMRQIISVSYPVSLLMGRVWFNYNRVFNEFEYIFSNPRRVQGGFTYILKIFFYYFIFIL